MSSWHVGVYVAIGVVVLAGLVVAWGVGLLETNRRRQRRASLVQHRIAEALTREPRLAGSAVLPVAETVPGRAITVTLTGPVPSFDAREVALGIAEREAAAVTRHARIVDRLEIALPGQPRRTA